MYHRTEQIIVLTLLGARALTAERDTYIWNRGGQGKTLYKLIGIGGTSMNLGFLKYVCVCMYKHALCVYIHMYFLALSTERAK